MLEIRVIGIGGIGCALLPHLSRYLNYGRGRARITLVDGDTFERGNAERQAFSEVGNKARVKASELAREFEAVSFRAIPDYVTEANVAEIIREGEVIFLGVDNHRTRNLVSDRCRKLSETVLISGGNDLTDGNVQVFIRRGGEDVTLPLTQFHPEIASPRDRSPAEMSCEELARTAAPQLLFTNLAIASAMLNAFYAWQQGALEYGEVYIDILRGQSNPVRRSPVREAPTAKA